MMGGGSIFADGFEDAATTQSGWSLLYGWQVDIAAARSGTRSLDVVPVNLYSVPKAEFVVDLSTAAPEVALSYWCLAPQTQSWLDVHLSSDGGSTWASGYTPYSLNPPLASAATLWQHMIVPLRNLAGNQNVMVKFENTGELGGWRLDDVTVGTALTSANAQVVVGDIPAPSVFAATAPLDGQTVNSTRPLFGWTSAGAANSINHYEVWVDGALSSDAISSATLSYTPSTPLAAGSHVWFARAVGTCGSTTSSPTIGFSIVAPAMQDGGPDAGPDGKTDTAVISDAPSGAGQDGLVVTSTSTGTATGTATNTATGTSTLTTTLTATATSIGSEPGLDGGDVPIATRDAAAGDSPGNAMDASNITLVSDTAGLSASDGMTVLVDATPVGASDATSAGRDGSQMGIVDGAGTGSAATKSSTSGGCGCVIGGVGTRPTWSWPMIALGLLALWRNSRSRRRGARGTGR